MATVTCGTGARDYTSLALLESLSECAWVPSAPEIVEFYNDGLLTGDRTLTGITPSATNTLTLRCATGQSHKDHVDKLTNARRCDQSYGVMFQFSAGFAFGLDLGYAPYVIVDGLQVQGSAGFCGAITGVHYTNIVQDCIFEN